MTLSLSSNVNNDIAGVSLNDIYLDTQGNLSLSRDLQAVLEQCAQAAKTQLGEMVLNTNLGIPYFETVWQGVPNIEQFTAALRQAFNAVADVIEVVSLITSIDNNTLRYTAIIRTVFGTGALNNGGL